MGPHTNLRGTLSPVTAISTIRRCGSERSLCSCFFNVESMKATFHWKLLSGQRWCPLRSPSFLSSRHRVSQNIYAEFPARLSLKRSVLCFAAGNGNLCNSKNKVVGCDKGSSLGSELQMFPISEPSRRFINKRVWQSHGVFEIWTLFTSHCVLRETAGRPHG